MVCNQEQGAAVKQIGVCTRPYLVERYCTACSHPCMCLEQNIAYQADVVYMGAWSCSVTEARAHHCKRQVLDCCAVLYSDRQPCVVMMMGMSAMLAFVRLIIITGS